VSLVIHDLGDAECVLRAASRKAHRDRNMIMVQSDDNVLLARVWPDGHIDATWEGSRYVSSFPTTEREPS
jgi:hypothetical protein